MLIHLKNKQKPPAQKFFSASVFNWPCDYTPEENK